MSLRDSYSSEGVSCEALLIEGGEALQLLRGGDGTLLDIRLVRSEF